MVFTVQLSYFLLVISVSPAKYFTEINLCDYFILLSEETKSSGATGFRKLLPHQCEVLKGF